jgi:hypothetical protein
MRLVRLGNALISSVAKSQGKESICEAYAQAEISSCFSSMECDGFRAD